MGYFDTFTAYFFFSQKQYDYIRGFGMDHLFCKLEDGRVREYTFASDNSNCIPAFDDMILLGYGQFDHRE